MKKQILSFHSFSSSEVENILHLKGGTTYGSCEGSRITTDGTTYLDVLWDNDPVPQCNLEYAGHDCDPDSFIGQTVAKP